MHACGMSNISVPIGQILVSVAPAAGLSVNAFALWAMPWPPLAFAKIFPSARNSSPPNSVSEIANNLVSVSKQAKAPSGL